MKPILSDYLEILKIPKWNKKKRNPLLNQWYQTDYDEQPSYAELLAFYQLCQDNNLIYNTHQFFKKVQFNLYQEDIFNHHNIEAIKYIMHHNEQIFYHTLGRYDINLLELGLKIDKNDTELLTIKLNRCIRALVHSIHEVPWGVLGFGMNGAKLENIPDLFEFLQETQQIADKLNQPLNQQLVADCQYYWTHWENYLKNDIPRVDFGFEEYLEKYGERDSESHYQ